MASDRSPSVFVSSTFYDLAQIRRDLSEFIESLGLEPVLSEHNTFPINPDQNTIDNCIRVVGNRADIFVLVVGGRYGSLNNDGTSITNLEFLKAKSKGIPIYIFVQKSISDMLSVWRDNPAGNFDSVVDSTKLFEFVESIRSSGDIWTFSFESAQDIISTLRRQLAYLFMNALEIRGRLSSTELTASLDSISANALRLFLEKPIAWEHRLFNEILKDELRVLANLKRDLTFGLSIGRVENLTDLEDVL
ncbi:MAG: DUF4062 domain-containing protein, partial [Chloroflexi bacterium]|nr:DUF4062 domain-containing protein [Chloroflexota bacterium]